MYKIIIHKYMEEDRELIANSYEEMRAVVTLCPEADYEILSVKKVNYDLAEEFLEEINKFIVPKDLVYGQKTGTSNINELLDDTTADDCFNFDGDNYPNVNFDQL